MVTLAHVRKFVGDNPKLFPEGNDLLARATEMAEGGDTLLAIEAEQLLGPHAPELFNLLGTNRDYLRISFEAAAQVTRK
ncbi:MAG: hypothetical protein V4481_02585 [Patescibacteria group bacterium]